MRHTFETKYHPPKYYKPELCFVEPSKRAVPFLSPNSQGVWCLFEFLLSSREQLELVFTTDVGVVGDDASFNISAQRWLEGMELKWYPYQRPRCLVLVGVVTHICHLLHDICEVFHS